jgi:hypothetical protein
VIRSLMATDTPGQPHNDRLQCRQGDVLLISDPT